MVEQRARRDLVLLLGGALVSTAGSSLTVVAVLIHLRPLGSGWVAAAFAAEIAPVVLLAAAALVPGRQGWLLAALTVVGTGASLVNPTVQALLPGISGEQAATRAFGWWSA